MTFWPAGQRRQLLIVVAAALLCAACDGSRQSGGDPTLLRRAVASDPESLDVHKARSIEAAGVQRDLGEGLIGYSPDGTIVPGAAERWEVSEDGLEYRFWLQPDAKWSNGEPVTAAHFVYAFQRLVDPATAAFYAQSLIDVDNAAEIIAGELPSSDLGVAAVGDLELSISLRKPVPYFLSLLTHPSAFPVYPPSVEEHGDAQSRAGNHVSNGAYKLDAWTIGSAIELSRNEHFRDNASTAIDRVHYIVTPESMVEINRYRAGELDITASIATEAFAQLQEDRPDEMRVAPYLTVYYYGFNMTKPPFGDDRNIRQALSMAIDRETLTEKVTGRGEAPAYSFVPPGVANYEPRQLSFATMSTDERNEAARRLYRQAGYSKENPLRFELRYNTSEAQRRTAVAIQSMWREVLGAEATLVNEEFQVLLANMRAREVTQVFRSSWAGDYNDAHTFLHIFMTGAPTNMPGYSNEEFDSLMERAGQQSDPGRRQLYMEEAERIFLDDQPVIPIYFYVSKHLVSPRVRGWQDNVLDYHYSRHLSLVD